MTGNGEILNQEKHLLNVNVVVITQRERRGRSILTHCSTTMWDFALHHRETEEKSNGRGKLGDQPVTRRMSRPDVRRKGDLHSNLQKGHTVRSKPTDLYVRLRSAIVENSHG